jgi:hypothetical protein
VKSRVDAELIIQALAGGRIPEHGETIIFDADAIGWKFGTPSASATLEFFIYTVGWYIVETLASQEPFGYAFIIDPTDAYLSVNVAYNDGGGAVSYDYDISDVEFHTLKQSDGSTPWKTGRTQTSFDITITPYDAIGGAAGAGVDGEPVVIPTGDAARSGRGVTVEQRDTTLLTGNFLKVTAPFDWDEDTGDDNEIILILTATNNAGSLSGNWTPNYNTSPTQRVSMSADLTLSDLSNMPDGGVMNLHFTLNAHTLTINSSNFEGPALSFSGEDFVALSIVDFGLTKYVIAGVEYS